MYDWAWKPTQDTCNYSQKLFNWAIQAYTSVVWKGGIGTSKCLNYRIDIELRTLINFFRPISKVHDIAPVVASCHWAYKHQEEIYNPYSLPFNCNQYISTQWHIYVLYTILILIFRLYLHITFKLQHLHIAGIIYWHVNYFHFMFINIFYTSRKQHHWFRCPTS